MIKWQALVCNLLWTICILLHELSPGSTLKTNQTEQFLFADGLVIPDFWIV